jgi:hypothetical protein
VPLLFAATLFVSASLLFMVQPMVGKMVLPLLGGSPAVWNACMVFFQLLLLLGYQYAHFVTGKYSPRKQWLIHLLVLCLPVTAFALAVMFGIRHSPIAIAESLAPSGDSSPVVGVLALLTVAIAVPFFVVSTSAPLLQKWFTATNHPSARDPYFLYSASNAGSLISLLGYPIFIEPYLSIVGQAWLFAGGFVLLGVLIFLCGRAAANPIGTPPPSAMAQNTAAKWAKTSGGANGGNANSNSPVQSLPASEPPPTLMRKLKWVALAFVPSSLMLGVTFYMTTDIASVPLLWVGPLALYLVTFIIAFGRVPDWFRIVIGNLAPVMILLLVFVMISGVNTGFFVTLLLHMLTFFAAALMCHYELARDRPSPKYLTEFFLLMSVGGVLGGIFNSLLAPILFTYPFEYKIVLLLACLLVPVLTDEEETAKDDQSKRPAPQPAPAAGETGVSVWLTVAGVIANAAIVLISLPVLYGESPDQIKLGEKLGTIEPMTLFWVIGGLLLAGIASVVLVELYGKKKFKQPGLSSQLWSQLPTPLKVGLLVFLNPLALPWATVAALRGTGLVSIYLDVVIAVLVGVTYFFLRQLPGEDWFSRNRFNGLEWFGRMVLKLVDTLGIAATTVVAVLISAVPVMLCFFFVDRPLRFALCVTAILAYSTYREEANTAVYAERSFFGILKIQEIDFTVPLIAPHNKEFVFKNDDGTRMIARTYLLRKLQHGTTLHGTQFTYPDTEDGSGRLNSRHILDDFQMLFPGATPLDPIAVMGATQVYDIRQEPLTYYHRSGPVGAMFTELRTRKNGTDATAPYAMIGLGTGSVSCYAQRGQSITFYEIDTAVKRLVADERKWFTYVNDARDRGANLDIRLGDARLVLKRDTDRKYTLLLVDAFSSDSIPVHLLTTEAVQLYLDRLSDDGILAVHISNRWIRLEPVVSAIANKLGLTARVWNDDAEEHAGKTASSWIVLARKPEHLGKLYTPLGDLPFPLTPRPNGDDRQRYYEQHTSSGAIYRHLMDLPVTYTIVEDFRNELEEPVGKDRLLHNDLSEGTDAQDKWLAWTSRKFLQVSDPDGSQRLAVFRDVRDSGGVLSDYLAAYRALFEQKFANPPNVESQRLKLCMELIRRYGVGLTLSEAMVREHGHAFRRLETLVDVPAWTDDYSDVLRVMGLPELQRLRKFFGLPTPIER